MGCLRKRGQIDARTDSRTARVNIETGRAVSFAEAEEHGSLSSVVSGKDWFKIETTFRRKGGRSDSSQQ